MMRKALPFALYGVIFAFATSCVAPAPAVDRQGNVSVRPASQSIRSQGLQLFEEIKRKKTMSHNPTYNGQLQRVATRLQRVIQLPGANWEFVVFQDRTPNAFALPGGKVGVHTGLFQIAQTDAQLATVVAHEIAHVTSNHAQDHRDGTRARESGNILHYLVRADGAGSGPGQQLAGLVGAAPALTGRPMILIWRPGALVMVPGHVVGQECLITLIIHSVTRAARLES